MIWSILPGKPVTLLSLYFCQRENHLQLGLFVFNHFQKEPEKSDGGPEAPKTTVFVGNISEKAPDVLIRQLLAVSFYLNGSVTTPRYGTHIANKITTCDFLLQLFKSHIQKDQFVAICVPSYIDYDMIMVLIIDNVYLDY